MMRKIITCIEESVHTVFLLSIHIRRTCRLRLYIYRLFLAIIGFIENILLIIKSDILQQRIEQFLNYLEPLTHNYNRRYLI